MLRFSDIALGTGGVCCLRCGHAPSETFRDVRAIKRDIDRAPRLWGERPGPNLAFTGAEPLRHPAIAHLFESAIAAGVERIRVDSDAAALQSADASGSALASGVRHLRFTLLGSTGALHDALAGTPTSFDATVDGAGVFARVAKRGNLPIYVSAGVPVCRHNLKDVPAIVDAASRAGACSVLLRIADNALDLRSAAPWLAAACDTGVIHATWVEVDGMPAEFAAGWELHLASGHHSPVEGGEHA